MYIFTQLRICVNKLLDWLGFTKTAVDFFTLLWIITNIKCMFFRFLKDLQLPAQWQRRRRLKITTLKIVKNERKYPWSVVSFVLKLQPRYCSVNKKAYRCRWEYWKFFRIIILWSACKDQPLKGIPRENTI